MFESQCRTAHENLLSGKCPWCGQVVIGGRTAPAETSSDLWRPPSLLRVRLRLLLLVVLLAGSIVISIAVALVATGTAFISSWSLVTASGLYGGVALGASITITLAMLGGYLWYAAWTRRPPDMKRRNAGNDRAANRGKANTA